MSFTDRLGARFLLLTVSLALIVGCGRQKQGERCSRTNLDADCSEDFVCTEAELLRANDGVDRCCPEVGDPVSDSRCDRRTSGGPSGTGGAANGGGGEGGSVGDGDSTGDLGEGSTCVYNSECREPLVCGPSGECQFECNRDRDCRAGEVCLDQSCVLK